MFEAHPGGTGRDWSRRDFHRVVLGGAASAGLGPGGASPATAAAESLLEQFRRTLSPEQRRVLVWPGNDPKRRMVQNHWAVVPAIIADLTASQQELALSLIRQVCTPEGFARLTHQRDDDAGGWKHDHLAVFGSPIDPDGFEWVVTGRHLTLRGSATGVIPRGPLFWGHTASGPTSLGARSAELAGTLFRALDADQRRLAIRPVGPGLSLADLGPEPQTLARQLLASLTEPFRVGSWPAVLASSPDRSDWDGVRWEVCSAGPGRDDQPPPIWRVVGPLFSWSWHAEPHRHCWFDSV